MSDPAAEQFLAWFVTERGRAPNTVAAYRRDLATYAAFLHQRGTSIEGARGADVEAFVAHLEHAGRRPSSIARALVAVRALHRYRMQEAGAPIDPARAITSGPVPVPAATGLSVAEVRALLDSVTGDGAVVRRDRALLELLYGAALRPSEVVALDRSDIGRDGMVTVRSTAAPRRVPAGGRAAEAVAEWLAPGGREALAPGGWSSAGDAGALFVNQRGRRLTRQGVWLILRRWATASGLEERMTPQALRHACALHLEQAGMPAHLVRELLGTAQTRRSPASAEALAGAHRRFHPRDGGEVQG